MKQDVSINRRGFFRSLALGVLGIGATALTVKAISAGGDCIGDGKCKSCFAFRKCELPLAVQVKKDRPEGKNV